MKHTLKAVAEAVIILATFFAVIYVGYKATTLCAEYIGEVAAEHVAETLNQKLDPHCLDGGYEKPTKEREHP